MLFRSKDTSGLYITTDLALEDETPSTLLPEKDTEPTDPAHSLVSDFQVCMFAQHNISRSHLQIINNVTKQLHLYAT